MYKYTDVSNVEIIPEWNPEDYQPLSPELLELLKDRKVKIFTQVENKVVFAIDYHELNKLQLDQWKLFPKGCIPMVNYRGSTNPQWDKPHHLLSHAEIVTIPAVADEETLIKLNL